VKRGIWLSILIAACGSDDPAGPDGGGGGAADAAAPADAGPPPEWAWVPVEGTRCMDDSATGMGVSRSYASTKLVIYMEGGGACFNAFTCGGVAHQNGYGPTDFAETTTSYGSRGIFNRADPLNPVRDWSFVFLPYCSGDIFAGDNEDGIGGRVHVGYRNVGVYLERLVDEFDFVDQVVLTGSSAGGYGAAFNFDRVQQAFGDDVEVLLLDDSGPSLSETYMTPCLQQQVREAWNLDATLPADCQACRDEDGGGLIELARFLGDKYPDRRFGLVQSTRDGVLRLFFGWGWPSCDAPQVPMPEEPFAEGVAELGQLMADQDNFHMFTIESGLHVWLLGETMDATRVGDVTLTEWVTGLIEDDPAFVNVGP
jgi:hypothetical protein